MKKTKTLFSCLLAVIMVTAMSMSMTAFAAITGTGEAGATETELTTANPKGTLKFTDVDGADSFKAFTVMTVSYDPTTNNMSYEPHADFLEFLASADNPMAGVVGTFEAYQNLTDDTQIKTLLGEYAGWLKVSSKTAAFTVTGTTPNNDVPLGQYVIVGTSATPKVFQVMTASWPVTTNTAGAYVYNKDVTINVKADAPTIEKESNKNSVSVGDMVPFTVHVTVPSFPEGATNKTFKIHDTMSSGLSFDIATDTTLVVKGSKDGGATYPDTLVANTHFTKGADANKTFTLTFNYDEIAAYTDIQVEYQAKVTSDAVTNGSATNDAALEFSNDPYGENTSTPAETKPDQPVTVHTYGADITVVEAGGTTPLGAGVEFDLMKQGENAPLTFTKQNDGTYIYDPNGSDKLITDANGKVSIRGLALGVYDLKETKASSGYQLPGTIQLTLADDDNDGNLNNDTDNILDFTVENAKINATLPQTGGIGTYVFVIVGLGIMTAACVAIIVIKKKAKRAE